VAEPAAEVIEDFRNVQAAFLDEHIPLENEPLPKPGKPKS
jgi:hypothetical protein